MPRYVLPVYACALSGCDFLTPHNFRNKPTCKFCDAAGIDWDHLLFACEGLSESGYTTFGKFMKCLSWNESTPLRPKLKKAKRILASLWNRKDWGTLTSLCFAINLKPLNLAYAPIISRLVGTMAQILHTIKHEWEHYVPDT